MIGRIGIQVEKKKLILGTVFIILGILSPSFIHANKLHIYELIYKSIDNYDNGTLIIAAFKLVILNCIRALPNYIGVFIVSESIKISFDEKVMDYFSGLVTFLIIPFIYKIIYLIYNIKYDLGVPALIVICLIIYLEKLNISTISLPKKSIIVILLLLGVQWMDIIPELSRFGFGRGDISKDIKLTAAFIDGSEVLTLSAIIFFIIFMLNAFLISKILIDEHKLIVASEINYKVERELAQTRLNAIEARTSKEMQNLVHDLKTPLTSMQALAGVIELMEVDEKVKIYVGKIIDSIDNLNKMISEILYEDKKSVVNTAELFEYILTQISTYRYANRVIYNNEIPSKKVLVNKIRFSRAIINLIDNSVSAIDKYDGGSICLDIKYEDPYIVIIIEDNGTGIEQNVIDKIWDAGFSTKNSTGLGLRFIKSVIENHNGLIKINSILDKGTKVKVLLTEVKAHEEWNKDISNRW